MAATKGNMKYVVFPKPAPVPLDRADYKHGVRRTASLALIAARQKSEAGWGWFIADEHPSIRTRSTWRGWVYDAP